MIRTERHIGDAKQLRYIKEQYNYLLEEKWKLEAMIAGRKEQRKAIDQIINERQKIADEIIRLDGLRTTFFLINQQ